MNAFTFRYRVTLTNGQHIDTRASSRGEAYTTVYADPKARAVGIYAVSDGLYDV